LGQGVSDQKAPMTASRQQRVERALFHGAELTLENPAYRHVLRSLADALLTADREPVDITVRALGIADRRSSAAITARQAGIAAGLTETAALLEASGLTACFGKRDGETIRPGDTLVNVEGEESKLLTLERVGLNMLQRMCGIATAAHCLQERASKHSAVRIVGTRKTMWGLLDKRALHVGGCGTHRLGLGDAILIKNNHLALLAHREEDAAPFAVERAWEFRGQSAFIEVEVRGEAAARAAAQVFRRLRESAPDEDYPCLLMLDNVAPAAITAILEMLRREGLWDDTLVEASGGVSEATLESYAATGVDAISIGALTHSARAMDLGQTISQSI
jgi:nicotinate-nucleotide pyrophosphorylase (carboxylating)